MKIIALALATIILFHIAEGYKDTMLHRAERAAIQAANDAQIDAQAIARATAEALGPYELQKLNGRGKLRFTSIEKTLEDCNRAGQAWGRHFTNTHSARNRYHRCIRTDKPQATQAAHEATGESGAHLIQFFYADMMPFTSSQTFTSLESCRAAGQIWKKEGHTHHSFSCIKKNNW